MNRSLLASLFALTVSACASADSGGGVLQGDASADAEVGDAAHGADLGDAGDAAGLPSDAGDSDAGAVPADGEETDAPVGTDSDAEPGGDGDAPAPDACTSECEVGETVCDGALAMKTCVAAGGGCGAWGPSAPCAGSEACLGDACAHQATEAFSEPPLEWPVPVGGADDAGFYALSGAPGGLGAHRWTTLDLDGDGRLDLVVTGIAGAKEGFNWFTRVPGHGDAPHWLVWWNDGQGFAASPVQWPVPDGGAADAGFNASSGSPGGLGADAWTLADLDGDGLVDLVVTGQGEAKQGYDWFTRVLGYPDKPHWEIHWNTGAGFASEPEPWLLPYGGAADAGFSTLSGTPGGVGHSAWATLDLDGDGKLELVVTGIAGDKPGYDWFTRVLGFPNDRHWDVHWSTGGGFSGAPQAWPVPARGTSDAGLPAASGSPDAVGDDVWALLDLDGDDRLDLVVTGQAGAKEGYTWFSRVLGHPDAPRWETYSGTPTGFSSEPTAWPVPSGGADDAGFFAVAGTPGALGGQSWTVTDVSGDGLPDIVVTATGEAEPGYEWFAKVLGYPTTPRWQVWKNTGASVGPESYDLLLPQHGAIGAGLHALSGNPGGLGGAMWSTVDLDGDGRLDLVRTGQGQPKEGYDWFTRVLGFGEAPRWDVLLGAP